MNRWLILQFAVDILLLLIIVFYILKDSLSKDKIPEIVPDLRDLKLITDSLNQLIIKAEKAAGRIKKNLDEEKKFGEELQSAVDKKTKEINLSIQKAVSILKKLNEFHPAADDNNSIVDKYDDVFRLHDNGLSIKEIAEKVGIPEGEVELICNLRR